MGKKGFPKDMQTWVPEIELNLNGQRRKECVENCLCRELEKGENKH